MYTIATIPIYADDRVVMLGIVCGCRFFGRGNVKLVWATITVLVAAATPRFATAQALPGAADPGRIEQRFQELPTPQSRPALDLPPPEQAPPPEKAAGIRFVLTSLKIDGVTVYGEGVLKSLWASLLNRQISLADVYKVRDALTARYRNDGYVLSQVLIPAQKVKNGEIRLQAVEGYIAKVSFEGATTDRLGLLDRYAEKITASRPLNNAVLERYVMLADDLPGVAARTVLRPIEGKTGAAELVFTLERKPFSGSVSLDNRGTKSVGRQQLDLSGEADDLAGLFEQITVRGIGAEELRELRYIDLGYTQVLDSEGTSLSLAFRRNWSRPGDTVAPLDVGSRGTTVRVAVSHPFIRTRAETLRGELAAMWRDSLTTSFGDVLSFDRVRVVSAGLTYDIADSWKGSNLFQVQLHKGLPILSSSEAAHKPVSREGARLDFVKVTALAQRNQPLTDLLALSVSAEGQYSPHQLVSSEEYGVGGKGYGRAFDPSEITGDSGVAGRVELQYVLPKIAPRVDYIQFYVFGEYGAVWNHESTRYGRRTLGDLGVGARYSLFDTATGSLEIDWPGVLIPGAEEKRHLRVFYNLSSRF